MKKLQIPVVVLGVNAWAKLAVLADILPIDTRWSHVLSAGWESVAEGFILFNGPQAFTLTDDYHFN